MPSPFVFLAGTGATALPGIPILNLEVDVFYVTLAQLIVLDFRLEHPVLLIATFAAVLG
jgi:hypothetical protein